ncbi:MAG: hypothetical protein MNPFHGCM_01807 [Gemmatimonadaceae bacterium]|nr:hypothetical protein [Gemmatimonadaceae bacterium]
MRSCTAPAALTLALLIPALTSTAASQKMDWPIHSMERPRPPVVAPGAGALPVPPPADAVVLLDGKSLNGWETVSKRPASWMVRPGYIEVAPGAGDIQTARGFGDVQLHVEWASPFPVAGAEGQDRGNSGVYLMGLYEVQVLDSYLNETYADGQAAAIYGQYPPLVDVSRPPGEWQSYDIVFRRPRFAPSGALLKPATMTVLHNGVLVQDHVALTGPTGHRERPPYVAHGEKLPIRLQDHGHRVRYRNIWVRELPGTP